MIKLINFIMILLIFGHSVLLSQDEKILNELFNKKNFLKELSDKSCQCIDSINTLNMSNAELSKQINNCIDEVVTSYQLITQLSNSFNKNVKDIDFTKKEGIDSINIKSNDIVLNTDKSSRSYKKDYYEIEEYLMENCSALKAKVAANDEMKSYSISKNREAQIAYTEGIDEMQKNNHKEAIDLFQKAVEIDEEFPFAWDNLGLCHRKLNNFDKAIECYKKSLEIDPFGMTPLQNMAVAYQHKKDFQSSIETYRKMAMIDDTNPEVYFGLGICYLNLENNLKSLENMCKAYNIYIKLNSPYRVDAQKVITTLYQYYSQEKKLDEFNETIKKYNIEIGNE